MRLLDLIKHKSVTREKNLIQVLYECFKKKTKKDNRTPNIFVQNAYFLLRTDN